MYKIMCAHGLWKVNSFLILTEQEASWY